MINKNEIKLTEKIYRGEINNNGMKNINFKIYDKEEVNKNKLNQLFDITFYPNLSNKNLNKSKSVNEFSKINFSNINYSSRNRANNIHLSDKKIRYTPSVPFCLSSMTNRKNFINSLENKFKIKNDNNYIIKSTITKKISKPINFNMNNDNIKLDDIKNKNNLRTINYSTLLSNNPNLKLNFSKIKKEKINMININKIISSDNKNKKIYYTSRNQKNLLNSIGTLNSNITFNTSSNNNNSIIPNKNNLNQQLSSPILIPFDSNTLNINTYNHKIKVIKPNNSSLDISKFITKDIKDKKIKRLLLTSIKSDKNQSRNGVITQNSVKLKDIHNYPTISLEEDKNKKNFYDSKINKNISDKIINIKDIKNGNGNNRLIIPYLFNEKNKNNLIESTIRKNNGFDIENIKEKNLSEFSNKINDNININDKINKDKKYNNDNIDNKDNKDSNGKNKEEKGENEINIKRKKINDTKEKNKSKNLDENKNKNKDNNKNKNKYKKIDIENHKFMNIFNIEEKEKFYSQNKFLNYIYSDIIKENENIYIKIKYNKITMLKLNENKINDLLLNTTNDSKIYKNEYKKDLNNLKIKIMKNKVNIKKDDKYSNIKNNIFNYKLSKLYFLSFKKFNLASLFSNYVFKNIRFSNIYLPIVKNNNVSSNNFGNSNLLNSNNNNLKSMNSLKLNKSKFFINNINSIQRFINLDFIADEKIRNLQEILDKINKVKKVNQGNKILRYNSIRKKKLIRHNTDLSFMTNINKDNKFTNTYKKFSIDNRRSSTLLNNLFKRKEFPHSILEKKQFFDVPKRSLNIKLKSALANSLLYHKLCGEKNKGNDDEEKENHKYTNIPYFLNNEKNMRDLINKKCIEKLKVTIHNKIKGKNDFGDNYNILKEIKGKKYIEETLRMLIREGQERLFLDYLERNYRIIDLNCRDENDDTFLILGVKQGLDIIVKELLEKNAEVNLRNNKGNTALHIALGTKNFSMVDLLKQYGADESIINKNGLTPWECVGKSIIGDNY